MYNPWTSSHPFFNGGQNIVNNVGINSTVRLSGGEDSTAIQALRATVGPNTGADEEYEPTGFSTADELSLYVPSAVSFRDPDLSRSSSSSPTPRHRIFQTNWDEYDSYRCGTPDLDELKAAVEEARERRNEQRQLEKAEEDRIDGVGELLSILRAEKMGPMISDVVYVPEQKQRIVLDAFTGKVLTGLNSRPKSKAKVLSLAAELAKAAAGLSDIELPPGPPHPTDPEEIRKLVRSKMPRCKVCRNRFGERNLLERHLRDHHHVEYLEYIAAQEEEIQLQKLEEQELNRIEELQSGGFIPPENDDSEANRMPLPGERANLLRAAAAKRPYRKKVSPQCNFCDKRFRNEVSLKKHLVKKHPESIEFVQCLDCFKCLNKQEDMTVHDCDLTFMCYECIPMRNLFTAQRLLLHRAKFHRGANSGFRCNECNLKFLTPRKLRKHKKMAHVFTKTYACHFCEELFTSEVSVITHERMHTGIIKFECLICDFRCNRYVEMEAHKREEHGYICSICRKPFAEWSEIKDHTLREHGGYLTNEGSTGYIESPRVWVMYKGE